MSAATRPLVSIIIPSHNYGRFVADAIRSAQAQSYGPTEIIVVDDGSTDDTPSVLRQFGGQLQVVHLDGQGVSKARNAGLATSSGEYVVFLDADDLLLPDAVHVEAAHLAAHPEVDAVCGAWYVCDVPLGAAAPVASRVRSGQVLPDILSGNIVTTPSAVMVRRRTLEDAGGFHPDLSFTADWEMWIRLAVRGHRFGSVPEPVAIYRIHGSSMTRDLERAARDVWYVLDRYTTDPAFPILRAVRSQAYAAMSQYLGKLYLEQGDEDGAQPHYRMALEYVPALADSVDLHHSMARAMWRHRRLSGSGDVRAAIEATMTFASRLLGSWPEPARAAVIHLAVAMVARSAGAQGLAQAHVKTAFRRSWRTVAARPHRLLTLRTLLPPPWAHPGRKALERLGLRASSGQMPALVSMVMATGGDGRPQG